MFPSVDRLGQGDSNGVAGWKQRRQKRWSEKFIGNFFLSRGDLMVAEDSEDEGEVVEVRYNH